MEKANIIDFIIAFEAGELNEQEIIDGFQVLIDTEMVWHLQGFYGRTASQLIEEGLCHARKIG